MHVKSGIFPAQVQRSPACSVSVVCGPTPGRATRSEHCVATSVHAITRFQTLVLVPYRSACCRYCSRTSYLFGYYAGRSLYLLHGMVCWLLCREKPSQGGKKKIKINIAVADFKKKYSFPEGSEWKTLLSTSQRIASHPGQLFASTSVQAQGPVNAVRNYLPSSISGSERVSCM